MKNYIESFARLEKKYQMTRSQYEAFLASLREYTVEDAYAHSTIRSLYYDTQDHRLILRSMEKPLYKEKLRMRLYGGDTNEEMPAFAELKKKFNHIVYKRRTEGNLQEIRRWLAGDQSVMKEDQISKELQYVIDQNPTIGPAMLISYKRYSLVDAADPGTRITFDTDILWRDWDLENDLSPSGIRLLSEDVVLMEVKISGEAIPLWLLQCIAKHDIRPSTISKYGTAFQMSQNSDWLLSHSFHQTVKEKHHV